MLTEIERTKHRVLMVNGRFCKRKTNVDLSPDALLTTTDIESRYETFSTNDMTSHGKKGYAAYTLNMYGELSLFNHTGMREDIPVAHSTMNAGNAVISAGEIKISSQGKLEVLTLHSGHYKPGPLQIYQTLKHLHEQGIDISNAKIRCFENFSSLNIQSPTTRYIDDVSSYESYYRGGPDVAYSATALFDEVDAIMNGNNLNAKHLLSLDTQEANREKAFKNNLIARKKSHDKLSIAIEHFSSSLQQINNLNPNVLQNDEQQIIQIFIYKFQKLQERNWATAELGSFYQSHIKNAIVNTMDELNKMATQCTNNQQMQIASIFKNTIVKVCKVYGLEPPSSPQLTRSQPEVFKKAAALATEGQKAQLLTQQRPANNLPPPPRQSTKHKINTAMPPPPRQKQQYKTNPALPPPKHRR